MKYSCDDLIVTMRRFQRDDEDISLPVFSHHKGRKVIKWFTCYIDNDDGLTTIRANNVFMYDGNLHEWRGQEMFSTNETVTFDVDLPKYVTELLETGASYEILDKVGQGPLKAFYKRMLEV